MTGWGIAGCGWVARDHALPGLLAAGASVVALLDRSSVEGSAATGARRSSSARVSSSSS